MCVSVCMNKLIMGCVSCCELYCIVLCVYQNGALNTKYIDIFMVIVLMSSGKMFRGNKNRKPKEIHQTEKESEKERENELNL